MTMAEHAEAWTLERGESVPPRNTPEWQKMYEKWHSWAFQDFNELPPSNWGFRTVKPKS